MADLLASHVDGCVKGENGRQTFGGENGLGEKFVTFSKGSLTIPIL